LLDYIYRKGIYYIPVYAPHITEDYETFRSRLNLLLGWPSERSFGSHDMDLAGSRIIPAFPDPTRYKSVVSTYGDSFTWGAEVDNQHAWSNLLSILLQKRVANYGVGGYGSDQAYLRFHCNEDNSRIVILGHYSENIMRNVNQFRNLIAPFPQCQVKPRFVLDGENNIRLIPIPEITPKTYDDLNNNPGFYFKEDFYIPGGFSGTTRMKFPYLLCLIRLCKYGFERLFLDVHRYYPLYRADHPSHGLQVTACILKKFDAEARERGKVPIVMLIPSYHDLVHFKKQAAWPYGPLISELAEKGLALLNAGEGLSEYLGERPPLVLYTSRSGHFNEEGNKAMAEIVYRFLQAHYSEVINASGNGSDGLN
jgi:hypothetical protein